VDTVDTSITCETAGQVSFKSYCGSQVALPVYRRHRLSVARRKKQSSASVSSVHAVSGPCTADFLNSFTRDASNEREVKNLRRKRVHFSIVECSIPAIRNPCESSASDASRFGSRYAMLRVSRRSHTMHEAKRLVSGLSSCRTSTSTHAANPDKSASCQFVMVGPLCRSSPVLH